MPIVLALIALAALIYGAVWSFDALDARFGPAVAVGVAIAVAAAVAAGIAYRLARRREIAPNLPAVKGEGVTNWTHELKRDWAACGSPRASASSTCAWARRAATTSSRTCAMLRPRRTASAVRGTSRSMSPMPRTVDGVCRCRIVPKRANGRAFCRSRSRRSSDASFDVITDIAAHLAAKHPVRPDHVDHQHRQQEHGADQKKLVRERRRRRVP